VRNINKRILLPAQYLGMEKDNIATFNEELFLLPSFSSSLSSSSSSSSFFFFLF